MAEKGRTVVLDLEIGIVELNETIGFLGGICPSPNAEVLPEEMMAMKAITPAGSRKKTLFMIPAERNAQTSVCFGDWEEGEGCEVKAICQ